MDPTTGNKQFQLESSVNVYSFRDRIYISNVKSQTTVSIYNLNGSLVKIIDIKADTDFNFNRGFWIVKVIVSDGSKVTKVYLE